MGDVLRNSLKRRAGLRIQILSCTDDTENAVKIESSDSRVSN